MQIKTKKALAVGWLSFLCVAIAGVFWYNDYVYSLPTPVPPGYHTVKNGKQILVTSPLRYGDHKPLFLHFFNPDCPCSRFNISHFKTLVKQYGKQTNFAVILTTDKYYTAEEVKKKFDLDVPVLIDSALAANCGVYSTPQAVILNPAGKLFYRGNYNINRYCTNEKTEFARMALTALLKNDTHVQFNPLALTAYGCSLPGCRK